MFEFSPGKPVRLSETTRVPGLSLFRHRSVQEQNMPQLCHPKNSPTCHLRAENPLTFPSLVPDARVFCFNL